MLIAVSVGMQRSEALPTFGRRRGNLCTLDVDADEDVRAPRECCVSNDGAKIQHFFVSCKLFVKICAFIKKILLLRTQTKLF